MGCCYAMNAWCGALANSRACDSQCIIERGRGQRPLSAAATSNAAKQIKQRSRRQGDGTQAKGARTETRGIVADAFRDPAHQRSEHKGCSSEEREASMERGGSGVFCVRFRELLQDVAATCAIAAVTVAATCAVASGVAASERTGAAVVVCAAAAIPPAIIGGADRRASRGLLERRV